VAIFIGKDASQLAVMPLWRFCGCVGGWGMGWDGGKGGGGHLQSALLAGWNEVTMSRYGWGTGGVGVGAWNLIRASLPSDPLAPLWLS